MDLDFRHLLFDIMASADSKSKVDMFSIRPKNKYQRIEKYNISSARSLRDRFEFCMKFKSSAEFRYVLKDILVESVLSKRIRNLNKCIDLFIVNNKFDGYIDKIRIQKGRKKEDILMLDSVDSVDSFDYPIDDDTARGNE